MSALLVGISSIHSVEYGTRCTHQHGVDANHPRKPEIVVASASVAGNSAQRNAPAHHLNQQFVAVRNLGILDGRA